MKIEITDQEALKKRVEFEIPQDVISDELIKICRQLGSTAQVKGFRPGKVPMPVLKRFYWSQIKSQIINTLVPEYYRKALEEAGLDTIGEPEFDDFSLQEGKPLCVKVTIEAKPFIEPKDYTGIEVEWKKVRATDEDVANMLARLQEKNAQFEVVEDRPIKEGDFVLLGYEGTIEGDPPNNVKDENIVIQIKGGDEISDFEKALIGINRNEKTRLETIFPDNFYQTEFRGKQGVLDVIIKEIKEKKVPDLDDEFARDLGEYDNLEELKNSIREQIQSNLEKQVENIAKEKILNHLMEKNLCEPPQKMIELRLDEIVDDLETRLRLSNSDLSEDNWDRNKIREELRPQSKRDVHVSIILESVARKEGLRPSEEEIDKQLRFLSIHARKNFEEFKEESKNNGTWDMIKTALSRDKAMSFIMEKAIKKEITQEN